MKSQPKVESNPETMTNSHLAGSFSWPGRPSAFQGSGRAAQGPALCSTPPTAPFTQAPVTPTELDTSLHLQTAESNERKITSYSSIHLAGEYYSLELKIIAWEYPRTVGSLSWKGCSVISSSLSSATGFTSESIAHRSLSLSL